MLLTDLPDDILIYIIKKFLNLNDSIQISKTCTRFYTLLNSYKIWTLLLQKHPVLDLNYPNDYDEVYRLVKYQNLRNRKYVTKIFYLYNEKMFPSIQIGDETRDTFGFRSVYLTDDNNFLWLNINDIYNYTPIENPKFYKKYTNGINYYKKFKIFGPGIDIRKFRKKENVLVCSSEKSIKSFLLDSKFELKNTINEPRSKINCIELSIKRQKIIYGCTDGTLKICDLFNNENKQSQLNLNDRIIRCCLSPCENQIAVGTAGINSMDGNDPCALRIHDFDRLTEKQILRNPGRLRIGSGVLALSYIDENLIMSAGYDTFIRIFDIRSNKCVQSLEEPEDMSICSVCCSKYYGLISGNDRQSIIRYWDRRFNRVISSFTASKTNSSIYSLASTPESIFACWDKGVTLIDFR
ncbi:unnamed protein product [Brachionus calyciflorus]|uniref:F-box domain-containing protein n=1 Tax=Brachionus calyciflorus TaxID=104777 RepID=A0A813M607_9BILA|nr:unnamed protein product [Brachionus calyciflorus]